MTTCETDKPQHEQDYETVKSALDSAPAGRWPSSVDLSALTRLFTQAAKVPGLEADNAALLAGVERLHGGFRHGHTCEMCTILSRPQPGAALLERLAKAESERDATRQSADDWQTCAKREEDAKDTAQRDLVGVTNERDAARQEVTELARLAEQRLSERNATESDAEALRERVAALDVRLEELTTQLADLNAEARVKEVFEVLDCYLPMSLNPHWQESPGLAVTHLARLRHDAEARVKELEAQLVGLEQCPRGDHSIYEHDATGKHPLCGAGTPSQPPPATAQGEAVNVCEHGDHPAPAGQRYCSMGCQRCDDIDQDGDDCAGVCGRDEDGNIITPTPPALVEVVGKLAEVWRETMRRYGRGMLAFPATYGEMETLLVAYDAAKGGGK